MTRFLTPPPPNCCAAPGAATPALGRRSCGGTSPPSPRWSSPTGSRRPTPATRPSGPGCACSSRHQQIREPEALGGWLKTTARRECLRILTEQRRIDPLPEGTECPDTSVDVERSVVDTDQARYLRGLLATLPARSFALISSLFQDDPPGYAQLSASTGIPVGSIGPTRRRALRRLRRLVEEGSGCAV